MNKNIIMATIIGLLLGSLITYSVVSNKLTKSSATIQQKPQQDSHMMPDGTIMKNDHSMSMQGMVDALKGKTGDEFDREFIKQMIPHHQGAIDMARAAQKDAGHTEIKNLAEEIITAQEKEIIMMREWQTNWGY